MDNDAKWAVYEANVQSYRSNMLSSQSFLLAVGALLIDKPIYLFIIIALIALAQIWFIWFRVIRARIFIVDYYKFKLKEKYEITEKEYVQNFKRREEINLKEADLRTNWRLTRIKIDILLPASITMMWIIMLIYKITIYYNLHQT